MPRPDDWEAVGRETLYHVLVRLASEIETSVEPVADGVYWGGEPDLAQVERLRRLAFEFEYAVEAYVAALADDAEPWGGDGCRAHPAGSLDGDVADGDDADGDAATDGDDASTTDVDGGAADDAGGEP